MNEFKGTPGPWNVNTIGKHWNNQSLTHIEVTFGMDGECVCDTVYEMADANLIAAAPELLEALQNIINRTDAYHSALEVDHGFDGVKLYEAAVNAITKALGEGTDK
jgi:hypothetical protein